ncbi:hypothetical protein Nepgr_017462 [Nepenthes gracilis]|uniref:Uncharacterized protein n=1 Tax=Nepenthes gracilis TaxID=150966 RepID=A0AAD3SSN6_NEPGR|nr:hypothetical protein Nepgr_017462 [Nepenthes gracilis]
MERHKNTARGDQTHMPNPVTKATKPATSAMPSRTQSTEATDRGIRASAQNAPGGRISPLCPLPWPPNRSPVTLAPINQVSVSPGLDPVAVVSNSLDLDGFVPDSGPPKLEETNALYGSVEPDLVQNIVENVAMALSSSHCELTLHSSNEECCAREPSGRWLWMDLNEPTTSAESNSLCSCYEMWWSKGMLFAGGMFLGTLAGLSSSYFLGAVPEGPVSCCLIVSRMAACHPLRLMSQRLNQLAVLPLLMQSAVCFRGKMPLMGATIS